MHQQKNVLFICGRNRLRSPTAEAIFSELDGIAVASAGLDHDADIVLSTELVLWSEVIFVMEKSHRRKLLRTFKSFINHQRIICLDIPDEFDYMQPELVVMLKMRVLRHLGL